MFRHKEHVELSLGHKELHTETHIRIVSNVNTKILVEVPNLILIHPRKPNQNLLSQTRFTTFVHLHDVVIKLG